jgi:hypothetical protein
MNDAPHSSRSRALLARATSRLLIVDMQTKLLTENCRRLIEGARLLGVPVDATEQYPKGLGPTVEPLAVLLPSPVAKLRFSAAGCFPWMDDVMTGGRHQVVVAGLEAHICLTQTALDLVASGFEVHVPADAIAGRKQLDYETTLRRLAAEGCVVTTWESVLFEWCETAEAAEFKALSKLVTGR